MENLDKIRKIQLVAATRGDLFFIYLLLLLCSYLVIFLVVEGKVKSIDNKLSEISARKVPKSTAAAATVSNRIGWLLVGWEAKKCMHAETLKACMHA